MYFEKADNERIAGKMQVHYRLSFDDDGIPMFYCFDSCVNFIRTVPNLVYDEVHVEDVNTKQEDHIYDEFRYFCMNNPIAPRINKKAIKPYNPLSDNNDGKVDRYGFMRL